MPATTSGDGAMRLWDVSSGRPIGPVLPGSAQHDVAAAFVDGGTHLVTPHVRSPLTPRPAGADRARRLPRWF